MFYKKAIEHCTIYENYNDFLKKINSMGAKLHFDPPHVSFNKTSTLTGEKFKQFIYGCLKPGFCYADLYKFNKQFIDSSLETGEDISLHDFMSVVDRYNDTNFSWHGHILLHNFGVEYYSDNDYNSILVIPEEYSAALKKVVDQL